MSKNADITTKASTAEYLAERPAEYIQQNIRLIFRFCSKQVLADYSMYGTSYLSKTA